MSLSLPTNKLDTFKQELKEFLQRKRASKRQLQAIAGRLSWAAGVVKGGRVFLHPIFNQISFLEHALHKAVISPEMCKDLLWWYTFLETFNGRSTILDQQPLFSIFTDACDDAAGGSFGHDWFYFNWEQDLPEAASLHINEKEVLAVVLAAQCWAKFWVNKLIVLHSDNMVTVACVNKGTSRNTMVMRCLRRLFWLSATYNFHLTARHLPGCLNIAADSASRLHSPGHLQTLLPFTAYSPLWLHVFTVCIFFSTGSRGVRPSTLSQSQLAFGTVDPAGTKTLSDCLYKEVMIYCGNTFAASTNKTYLAQRTVYFDFPDDLHFLPFASTLI